MAGDTQSTGRKIFLVDFPNGVNEELITLLIRNEIEVYSLSSAHLSTIVENYSKAVAFCFIPPERGNADVQPHNTEKNAQLPRQWVSDLLNLKPLLEESDLRFYFCSPSETAGSFCGHIDTPVGKHTQLFFKESITDEAGSWILSQLEILKVKGQRQYVRFLGEENAEFSFSIGSETYAGKVYDISSAGMSCAFSEETVLPIGASISNLRLSLLNKTYTISGKTLLQRRLDQEKRLFVVMFDRRMTDDLRHTLQDFIHSSLQAKFEARVATSQ